MGIPELKHGLQTAEPSEAELITTAVLIDLLEDPEGFECEVEDVKDAYSALGNMPGWFRLLADRVEYLPSQSREDLINNLTRGMEIGVLVVSRLAQLSNSLSEELAALSDSPVLTALISIVDEEIAPNLTTGIGTEYRAIGGTIPSTVDIFVDDHAAALLNEDSAESLAEQAMDVTWGAQLCALTLKRAIDGPSQDLG